MGKVFRALNKASGPPEKRAARAEPGTPGDLPSPGESPSVERRHEPTSAEPVAAGAWDERLMLATTVRGAAAESFRTLRTRILHPDSGPPPRTLLVTSAVPGEGKSFVCANLGISLAQGVDTYSLLVDADLRKPSLHGFFGLGNEKGLADHLRDDWDLGKVIVNCGVKKLSLLPAGAPPVNPAELLGASAMTGVVEELAGRYDDRLIIFDSPPAQVASETLVLAKQVDGIILVVRWGGSRREHVQELLETMGREKVVAVVFNAFRATIFDTRFFGSYEYQQNYHYGVR